MEFNTNIFSYYQIPKSRRNRAFAVLQKKFQSKLAQQKKQLEEDMKSQLKQKDAVIKEKDSHIKVQFHVVILLFS